MFSIRQLAEQRLWAPAMAFAMIFAAAGIAFLIVMMPPTVEPTPGGMQPSAKALPEHNHPLAAQFPTDPAPAQGAPANQAPIDQTPMPEQSQSEQTSADQTLMQETPANQTPGGQLRTYLSSGYRTTPAEQKLPSTPMPGSTTSAYPRRSAVAQTPASSSALPDGSLAQQGPSPEQQQAVVHNGDYMNGADNELPPQNRSGAVPPPSPESQAFFASRQALEVVNPRLLKLPAKPQGGTTQPGSLVGVPGMGVQPPAKPDQPAPGHK